MTAIILWCQIIFHHGSILYGIEYFIVTCIVMLLCTTLLAAALAAISEAALHMNSRITDLVGLYGVQWSMKGQLFTQLVHITCLLSSKLNDSGKPGVGDENSTAIYRKGQPGYTWTSKNLKSTA